MEWAWAAKKFSLLVLLDRADTTHFMGFKKKLPISGANKY